MESSNRDSFWYCANCGGCVDRFRSWQTCVACTWTLYPKHFCDRPLTYEEFRNKELQSMAEELQRNKAATTAASSSSAIASVVNNSTSSSSKPQTLSTHEIIKAVVHLNESRCLIRDIMQMQDDCNRKKQRHS